jgi:hypothetical protein
MWRRRWWWEEGGGGGDLFFFSLLALWIFFSEEFFFFFFFFSLFSFYFWQSSFDVTLRPARFFCLFLFLGKAEYLCVFFFSVFFLFHGGRAGMRCVACVIRLKWPLFSFCDGSFWRLVFFFFFFFFVYFFFCCLPLIYCCRLCGGEEGTRTEKEREGRRGGTGVYMCVCVISWDGMGNLWIRRDGRRLCPRPPWCEEELL